VHAEGVLEFDIAFEIGGVLCICRYEQVAALPITDLLPGLVVEALKHGQAFLGEPDIDRGGELISHAASTSSGCTLAEEMFLLKQDDVFQTSLGKVVGGAGAHDASANDDNFRTSGYIHVSLEKTRSHACGGKRVFD
jgi:hypothetical protein